MLARTAGGNKMSSYDAEEPGDIAEFVRGVISRPTPDDLAFICHCAKESCKKIFKNTEPGSPAEFRRFVEAGSGQWFLESIHERLVVEFTKRLFPGGQRFLPFDDGPMGEFIREQWQEFFRLEVLGITFYSAIPMVIGSMGSSQEGKVRTEALAYLNALLEWHYRKKADVDSEAEEDE
jgi:hypothetical protein